MEDKKRNGRRNAEPIDFEEQDEGVSEAEYEPCTEEETEEEYEQGAEEEYEEEWEQYAEEESEGEYEQCAEEEYEEEWEQYAEEESEGEYEQCAEEESEGEYEECDEEEAEEEADSSDENPFGEAYYDHRVRKFTPDIPPFLRNKRSGVEAGRTFRSARAEKENDSSDEASIDTERPGRHERRFTSDVPPFMRNRRSAAETDSSEDPYEDYENYDEYSGFDDDYEEEIEKHWELPFIAKVLLALAGIVVMVVGCVFMLSEPEVEESYEVGMGRAPEVVYVPVGGSVTFTVQAGEEDLAWLDEKGRVNIGVENVELTAQTEGAACTLTAAKAEDPAHRSNPQTYTVTGEAPGTMIATFDLSYDRYRVSGKGKFASTPSEVYEFMPWTTVVISVYPPSAEITIPFEKVTVSAGASFDLQTQVAPEDVKYAQIVYVSSNPSVAQADESGVVETFEEGTAVITAQMSDGSGTTASCTVEVLPARKLPEAEK